MKSEFVSVNQYGTKMKVEKHEENGISEAGEWGSAQGVLQINDRRPLKMYKIRFKTAMTNST